MKRTPKYVGLDVHQATTVASVREESGRVVARSILPTEETALLEFFSGMRGSVHVAFEEGTQAQWLHDLLSPRVHRVVVCDRRGEKKHGNKGDVVDADQLCHDLLHGALRAVYHGSGHRAALKELARTYENAVEDTTRTMLRLKALFRHFRLRICWCTKHKGAEKSAGRAATPRKHRSSAPRSRTAALRGLLHRV